MLWSIDHILNSWVQEIKLTEESKVEKQETGVLESRSYCNNSGMRRHLNHRCVRKNGKRGMEKRNKKRKKKPLDQKSI